MAAQTRQFNGKPSNPFLFSLMIGFFAGLIWGGIRMVQYYFNLTDVIPAFLLRPFFSYKYLTTGTGHWLGWAMFTVMSICAALLYALVLRKLRGPFPGILLGIVWWGLLYGWIGPASGMFKPLHKLGLDSICTDFTLYVVWGLFIGYSIAFEFTDERSRDVVPPGSGGETAESSS